MTHETLMSKIVKIFQGPTDRRTDGPTDRQTDRPTDMTTPRSSDPELKNLKNLANYFYVLLIMDFLAQVRLVCFAYPIMLLFTIERISPTYLQKYKEISVG